MTQEQIEKIINQKTTVKDTILFNTRGLSDSLLENVKSYYRKKLDNTGDEIHFNNMHRVIFYKTIEHSALALFLFDLEANSFIVNEGYFHHEILQLINNYKHFLFEKKEDQVFQVYLENDMFEFKIRLQNYGSKYYVYGALAPDVSLLSDSFENVSKILYRFYFQNHEFSKNNCYYDIMPEINKTIEKIKHESQEKGQKMHLVLIQTEPLNKYIKVAGDYLVNEIIKSVKDEIVALTGNSGRCHILNSRQYLIVTHGVDEEFIKEKFGRVTFRIKNLLLVYQMNFYEVENLDNECNIAVAWNNLAHIRD